MITLEEFITDLDLCLSQEGVADLPAYYTSGVLSDTKYTLITKSILNVGRWLLEIYEADPAAGEEFRCSEAPLLFIQGAGLYFVDGEKCKPIRETIIEEIFSKDGSKEQRLALMPYGVRDAHILNGAK